MKTPAKSWDDMIDIRGILDARVQIVEAAVFFEADVMCVIHDSTRDAAGHPELPIALKPIRNPPPARPANNFPTLLPKLGLN